MKRIFRCALRAILASFLVFILYTIIHVAIVHFTYPTLQEWFPKLFKTYSAISEKEELAAANAKIAFVSTILSFFIMPFLEKRFDNSRFEYIIDETDGFYHLKSGLSLYMGTYTLADSIALILAPAPYIPLLLVTLPKKLERTLGFILTPLDPFRAIADISGLVGAYFVIVAVALISQIPANLSALKHWRGIWLAEIE